MELQYITNATIERNLFVNRTRCCHSGAAINARDSSVLIRQCIVSNNRVFNGAIFGYRSNFIIEQTTFRSNNYPYTACCDYGRALYLRYGNVNIFNCNFANNSATYDAHGGAIYAFSAVMAITRTYFSDNIAGDYGEGQGGAVYFDGNSITVTNSTFINNRANGGEGGAIYSARQNTNISLVNSFFSHNTAAYCGVMKVAGFYHYHVNITTM